MIKHFLKNHPVHKKIVPNFDLLFLLRPTLFFSVWVMVAIGMYCAHMSLMRYPLWISELSLDTFLIFVGLTCVCSSTFIINQIYDLETDTVNNKLFLVGDCFNKEKSRNISIILMIAGFLISFLANWITASFVICIYLVWGILYNKPPYCWKQKPLLGLFSNIIVGILLFLIGWYIVMTNEYNALCLHSVNSIHIYILPYILCFTSVALLTNIPDIKGDSETGVKTFPIAYGQLTTLLFSMFMIIFAFVFSVLQEDPIASTTSLISLPFFIVSVIRRLDKDVLRAIRYPIFILNFFTLTIYPWLFLPLIIIFYFSKYYYWHRFDLHYPTLLVDND